MSTKNTFGSLIKKVVVDLGLTLLVGLGAAALDVTLCSSDMRSTCYHTIQTSVFTAGVFALQPVVWGTGPSILQRAIIWAISLGAGLGLNLAVRAITFSLARSGGNIVTLSQAVGVTAAICIFAPAVCAFVMMRRFRGSTEIPIAATTLRR